MSQQSRWTPARLYLVLSGVGLLVIAAAGFIVSSSFPTAAEEVGSRSGHIFGIFETNGWHNLAGLSSGVLALGLAAKPEWARFGALLKGSIYVVVTTSIAIWGGDVFLVASNTADQVLHAALAIGGISAGLITPSPHPSSAPGLASS